MNERWSRLVERLRGVEYRRGLITPESPVHRIELADGLTDSEIATVEDRFAFRFPADLRALLQAALPLGSGFPDWRAGDPDVLRTWVDAPARGVLEAVEEESFWLTAWGPRPRASEEAVALVARLVDEAPRMIPIFAHRAIPDRPSTEGNPVLSLYGVDIICYGVDLAAYFAAEFHLPGDAPAARQARDIPFWSALVG